MIFAFVFVLLLGPVFSAREKENHVWSGRVKEMFYFGYDSYMHHAFPQDELKPISCSGVQNFGNYSLTLIDSLDMLVVLENYSEFEQRMWWIADNVHFDLDVNVSVFETNIRILGGLLSSHMLITESGLSILSGERVYRDELLHLASDLGYRLLPAFDTKTKIPYGTVNLKYGVPHNETPVTCVASGGTFGLEFGILSVLLGDPVFMNAAKDAVLGLFNHRSAYNLVGNHINVQTGAWISKGAGVGGGSDSFFEYLFKVGVFFNDHTYLTIFEIFYNAYMKYTKFGNWYMEVNMDDPKQIFRTVFESLQGFWPGLQVLFGKHVDFAMLTMADFHSLWNKYGFSPEVFNLLHPNPDLNNIGYPLRPEMAESLYLLSTVMRDPLWLQFGRDMVSNLNLTRVNCGFAAVQQITTHELRDNMDSFFLSETMKYLYLLFNASNFITKSGRYIFNTEAHMYPMSYKYQKFCELNEKNRANGNFDSTVNANGEVKFALDDHQCQAIDNVIYTYTKQCSKVEVIIHSLDAKHFIRKWNCEVLRLISPQKLPDKCKRRSALASQDLTNKIRKSGLLLSDIIVTPPAPKPLEPVVGPKVVTIKIEDLFNTNLSLEIQQKEGLSLADIPGIEREIEKLIQQHKKEIFQVYLKRFTCEYEVSLQLGWLCDADDILSEAVIDDSADVSSQDSEPRIEEERIVAEGNDVVTKEAEANSESLRRRDENPQSEIDESNNDKPARDFKREGRERAEKYEKSYKYNKQDQRDQNRGQIKDERDRDNKYEREGNDNERNRDHWKSERDREASKFERENYKYDRSESKYDKKYKSEKYDTREERDSYRDRFDKSQDRIRDYESKCNKYGKYDRECEELELDDDGDAEYDFDDEDDD